MSAPVLQPELRALEVVDVIPAGCFGVLVTSDDFEPHLRHGEIAVVDTADKERQFGELYAIVHGTDPRRIHIVEIIRGGAARPESVGVWMAYSLRLNVDLGQGRMTRMIDGPLLFEHWPRYCQGRIVGVMVPR